MRRTKIVATLGPASDSPETLAALIKAGVDVFRLNFSHGTHEEHAARIARIRSIGKKLGRHPAILQDLCGPKIRVGEMENGAIKLVAGQKTIITMKQCLGTPERFCSQYTTLAQDVKKGDRILLDDGALEMAVLGKKGQEVTCQVVVGGTLKNKKGMNLPGVAVSAPAVTEKDWADLEFGLKAGVDFVALSFVRKPEELHEVKRRLMKEKRPPMLIAKVERPEAVERMVEIVSAADCIMVARGDLGVEMDVAKVPLIQKRLIRCANELDKPVITATQMLESMIESPRPTRAEVSDVANAILDGSDAIMLSGETAAGKYPVEAVATMDRIAKITEASLGAYPPGWDWERSAPILQLHDAIGQSAKTLAESLEASIVIAASQSGGTALFLSKNRLSAPIIAFTKSDAAARRMRLFWGVEPVCCPKVRNKEQMVSEACKLAKANGWAKKGEVAVLVAGPNFGHIGDSTAIEAAEIK